MITLDKDDGTTVAVTVNNETFYVQTVDGVYRGDLGCWITTDTSDGEIDYDDYTDFDIDDIVKTAEKYIQSLTEEIETDYKINNKTVYIIIRNNNVDVVTHNEGFINKDTSSYQREFSAPIESFDNKNEALQYLSKLGEIL